MLGISSDVRFFFFLIFCTQVFISPFTLVCFIIAVNIYYHYTFHLHTWNFFPLWHSNKKWKYCDCNWTGTQDHLVCKWTLNYFAKMVWPNDRVFIYELSGCGFDSSCSHKNFSFSKQEVPWHSGNYRVWIHSEMCMWDDNIQLWKYCL